MDVLQTILDTMIAHPIWTVSAVIVGGIIGFFTHKLYLDRATMVFLGIIIVPFTVGRLIATLVLEFPSQATGSGILGTVIFTFYVIAFIIGRRVAKFIDN